jgi:fatty acid amide hydrolase
MHELKIDALICPAFPIPPPEHSRPGRIAAACFATAYFNLLDYPAGIVPVGRVTEADDVAVQDDQQYPTGRFTCSPKTTIIYWK